MLRGGRRGEMGRGRSNQPYHAASDDSSQIVSPRWNRARIRQIFGAGSRRECPNRPPCGRKGEVVGKMRIIRFVSGCRRPGPAGGMGHPGPTTTRQYG